MTNLGLKDIYDLNCTIIKISCIALFQSFQNLEKRHLGRNSIIYIITNSYFPHAYRYEEFLLIRNDHSAKFNCSFYFFRLDHFKRVDLLISLLQLFGKKITLA